MRPANSNITVLNIVTAVELRVPECVRIADRHEHTAESALVKFLKREIRK